MKANIVNLSKLLLYSYLDNICQCQQSGGLSYPVIRKTHQFRNFLALYFHTCLYGQECSALRVQFNKNFLRENDIIHLNEEMTDNKVLNLESLSVAKYSVSVIETDTACSFYKITKFHSYVENVGCK
jgi:hypothetical protein